MGIEKNKVHSIVLLIKKSRNSSRFWKRGLSCNIQFNCKKAITILLAAMKRTSKSSGKECAAFGCSSRSCCFVNKERKPIWILYFKFPKSKVEINDWCNLIKRQNDKDGFVVKENSTYICSKHFHVADIYRDPGGTRHSLIKGSRPKLHSWNTF